MSKTIVFFGNERLATGVTTAAPTLRGLIQAGYNIATLVVAQNEQGSSRKQRKLEIVEVAEEHHIPVLSPAKLSEVKQDLQALQAQAGVLVAYGKVVPQDIIDIFPKGIINIHPSLLPKHRGSTPIESAILNGDLETGVSLMQLTAGLDSGPVYGQLPMRIKGVSKEGAANTLNEQGARLVLDHLPSILDGSSAEPAPQDEALATHDKRISKDDGAIDTLKSAEQLEREIRAYAGWPRSRMTINGKAVVITKAKVAIQDNNGTPGSIKTKDGKLLIFCKWGALEIESLIPAGKKEMSAKAFLAGYTR